MNKYGVIADFPANERNKIWDELVSKSGGLCQLCEEPMDVDSDDVIVEHKQNGGAAEVWNLYIAHRGCNSLKTDLPYEKAKTMITFKKFAENRKYSISFDDIIDKYLSAENRKPVKIEILGESATLIFNEKDKAVSPMFIDPATKTKYFFTEVPVGYIHNDRDVQPRKLDWSHAWRMALDFELHPIHEPSACRVNVEDGKTSKLLQFDGQHKAAAQILLGRTRIPMKVYVDPDIKMIRELIIITQNTITKVRLAPATYLDKMQAVYRDKLQESGAESERKFVDAYLVRERGNATKQLFSSIYETILKDPANRFTKYVQPEGTRPGKYPVSMNLVIKILRSLISNELQTVKIGSPEDFRLEEADNVVFILNIIADELLEQGKWSLDKNAVQTTDYLKAKRFFKSGAVGYWTDVLREAIIQRLTLINKIERKSVLLRKLTDKQKELIKVLILRMVNHAIWTDNDGNIDTVLNENKKETSDKFFSKGTPEGYKIPLDVKYLMDMKA